MPLPGSASAVGIDGDEDRAAAPGGRSRRLVPQLRRGVLATTNDAALNFPLAASATWSRGIAASWAELAKCRLLRLHLRTVPLA